MWIAAGFMGRCEGQHEATTTVPRQTEVEKCAGAVDQKTNREIGACRVRATAANQSEQTAARGCAETRGTIRMKYSERKQFIEDMAARHRALMDSLDPEALNGGTTKAQLAEGHFRYYVIQLLADFSASMMRLWADVADAQAQTAYCYGEMLRIQQEKSGRGTQQPKPQQQPNGGAAELPKTPPEESRYGRGNR